MKKHIFSLFSLLFLAQITWAVDHTVTPVADLPAYYASINNKSGSTLRDNLYSITIAGPQDMSYDGLFDAYPYTDVYPSDSVGKAGKIWDMYSNVLWTPSANHCGNYNAVGDCFNREHSVPKSWFNEKKPAYYDLGHLVPTDGYVNNQRGNNPFGECSGGKRLTNGQYRATGRSGTSTFEGYTSVGTVFEPDDQYKGDFARIYMYMAVRYKKSNKDDVSISGTMFNTTDANYGFTAYSVALLMKWHRLDPVSQKEIDRNNGMQRAQNNRNPFIDYPILAEYLWGNMSGETFLFENAMASFDPEFIPGVSDGTRNSTDPVITSPKGTVNLGATDTEHSASVDITVAGANLEDGNLTLALSGDNASYFSLAATTVTKAQAESGYAVTVSYAPQAEGNHTATLTISGCGVNGHTVQLTGKCTLVHTITWVDNQGQQTTTAATGDYLVLPANQPADCSSDRVFMGWTAQSEVSSKPSDLFTEPSGSISAPATYYAVYADKTIEGGGEQVISKAASIAVGDKVIIVCEDVSKELSEFSTASTIYGLATAYTTTPVGILTFDVLEGKSSGTFAFKNGNDYLNWSSGNSLSTATALSDNTSWKVTIISGNATMLNAKDNTRRILWNKSSPRFACYTQSPGTNYYNIQLYKLTGGTTITYSNYSLHCEETPAGLDSPTAEQIAHKVLVGGQIYIQVGKQLFTITGQRVK